MAVKRERKLQTMVTHDLYERLEAFATSEKRSISSAVELLLEEAIRSRQAHKEAR